MDFPQAPSGPYISRITSNAPSGMAMARPAVRPPAAPGGGGAPAGGAPGQFQFGMPGNLAGQQAQAANPMLQGYNGALQQLQKSLQASNDTTAGVRNQLQTQLQNNTAQIGQNLTSRGLGNSTVMATAPQAAMQTFNQGMLSASDTNAQRQMGAYGNLAGMMAQGGSGLSNFASPYAQAQYSQSLAASLQQQYPQG